MNNYSDFALNERPYEKCKEYGPTQLTDSELLAVILRTGTKEMSVFELSKYLLGENSDGQGIIKLSDKTMKELQQYHGVGEVKSILLVCIFELAKRMWKAKVKKPVLFNNPRSIADYYYEDLRYLKVEKVMILLLNTKGALIKELVLSSGTINHCVISARDVFIGCLKYEAVNFIMIHNHPSGDPTPSNDDIKLTRNIAKAGELIDIHMLDHIVIGDHRYVSLKEEGYI